MYVFYKVASANKAGVCKNGGLAAQSRNQYSFNFISIIG